MLNNHLKIALRNLLKHKGYTFINIAGLAVGMACCYLILLYVRHELSYDRFHSKADRIFRVLGTFAQNGETSNPLTVMAAPIAPALQQEYPEVLGVAAGLVEFFLPVFNELAGRTLKETSC
jgi:putative ABC transport system permease protein